MSSLLMSYQRKGFDKNIAEFSQQSSNPYYYDIRMSSRVSSSENAAITPRMWISAVMVAQPSFVFGYALAALNSCFVLGDDTEKQCYDGDHTDNECPIGSIYRDMSLDSTDVQLATALTILGAWMGSMAGSLPGDKYGRRWTVLWDNLPIILGGIATASGNKPLLFIGRFIIGLAVGIESVVVPCLLSEMASEETRGTITIMHQLMITFAIFLVALVAYGFVTYVAHGWQYVQAFIAIPSIIMLIFNRFVPESPKWLLQQGQAAQARDELKKLRTDDWDVDAEITEIQMDAKQSDSSSSDNSDVTWGEVFSSKKAVIVGIGLMGFNAITGINTVVFYSTTIFGFAGFSEQILATASVGFTNFAATVFAIYYIDRLGRKTFLLTGSTIMLFALMVLSLVLTFGNGDEKAQGFVAVFATLTFVIGFAIGLGPLSWVVMSEMLPTRLRTKAFGLFLSVNWCANLIIGLFTLTAIEGLGGVTSDMDDDDVISDHNKSGVAYLYFLFSGITAVCIAFIFFVVPETKGKTPEQLQGLTSPLLLSLDEDDGKFS